MIADNTGSFDMAGVPYGYFTCDGLDSTTGRQSSAVAMSEFSPEAVNASLPFELKEVVQRYPVTLYTSASCSPCASARNLLVSRIVSRIGQQKTTGTIPALLSSSLLSRFFSLQDWLQFESVMLAAFPVDAKMVLVHASVSYNT